MKPVRSDVELPKSSNSYSHEKLEPTPYFDLPDNEKRTNKRDILRKVTCQNPI